MPLNRNDCLNAMQIEVKSGVFCFMFIIRIVEDKKGQ